MIAATSCALNTKIGMSGWPKMTMPSVSDSARSSTGYLWGGVQKGGASGCGITPSPPMAWQREQFPLTSASPLTVKSVSAACPRDQGSHAAPGAVDKSVMSGTKRGGAGCLPALAAFSPLVGGGAQQILVPFIFEAGGPRLAEHRR